MLVLCCRAVSLWPAAADVALEGDLSRLCPLRSGPPSPGQPLLHLSPSGPGALPPYHLLLSSSPTAVLSVCCFPPPEEFSRCGGSFLMTLILIPDPPFRTRLALGRRQGMLTKFSSRHALGPCAVLDQAGPCCYPG